MSKTPQTEEWIRQQGLVPVAFDDNLPTHHVYVLVNRERLRHGLRPWGYIGQTTKSPASYYGSGTMANFDDLFNADSCDYYILKQTLELSHWEVYFQHLVGIGSIVKIKGWGPWANKMAYGGTWSVISKEERVRRGLLQPKYSRSLNSIKAKMDPTYREKLKNADYSLWEKMFPHLPALDNAGVTVKNAPRGKWIIRPTAIPKNLNPLCGRGLRLQVAYSSSDSWEFRDRYEADESLWARHARYGKHPWNACLGQFLHAGWIALVLPR